MRTSEIRPTAMISSKVLITLAASTAMLAVSSCAAPPAAAKPRPSYATIAQDPAQVEALFRSLDANGDGYIKFNEVGGADPRIDMRFELADRNHDGRLDRAEFHGLMADLARKELSARR